MDFKNFVKTALIITSRLFGGGSLNQVETLERGAEFEAKRRAHPPIPLEDQKAISQEAKEIFDKMERIGVDASSRDSLLDAKDRAIEQAHNNYWRDKEAVREKYKKNHLEV